MTIQEIKKELAEMSEIADRNKPDEEGNNFAQGYYYGYKRAINDLQRSIQSKEYLEKMEKLYGEEE